jgi:hypothetical protein
MPSPTEIAVAIRSIADKNSPVSPGDNWDHHTSVSDHDAPPARPAGLPSWQEIAEDWLAAKRVGRSRNDPGNSDRARRADLRRWAAAINEVQGRQVPAFAPHSLDGWHYVMTELGDVDVLPRALDLSRRRPGALEPPTGAVDDARVLRLAGPA